jgi:ABC-type polysaccharide/polyol phosphate export permease
LSSTRSEPISTRPPRPTDLSARAGALERLRANLDLLVSLSASDLRLRHGRGPLVVVRWLLEPFALVGVYLVLLVVVLDRPGESPGLSLACAIIPFQFVISSVTYAMTAVSLRRPIIANMAFKRTLIPLSTAFTESAGFAASFLIIFLMMAIYGVAPTAAFAWLPAVVIVTITLGVGFAYPASLFGLWFWELRPFGSSLMRILFFIGPGLVPLSQTGATTRGYLKLNPLTGLFESFRDVFLYGRAPGAWDLLYPFVFAVVLLAVFVPLYRRDQTDFAKVI